MKLSRFVVRACAAYFFLLSIAVYGQHGPKDTVANPVDPAKLEADLKGNGLEGWVHGANANTGIFVFTWRDPKDFFTFVHFPMTTQDAEVLKLLKTLDRHDKVKIIGEYIDNEAPKKHIRVSKIELLQKGTSELPHEVGIPFPNELHQMNEISALVHIVEGDGSIMVIEYKDSVIPVFVKTPEVTKGLYRNDKIRFKYKIRSFPKRPSHLELDSEQPDALKVVERIVDNHGKQVTIEGSLIRFPRSEQTNFDVYALQATDADGLKRNFTLVNFEDMTIFKAIRQKMAKVWDSEKANAVNARNKWELPHIKVKASGLYNMVDPGQANPQILLESPDSIQIFKKTCTWDQFTGETK